MLRVLIAMMAVAALAVPAAAYETSWDFPSGGTQNENIDIYLTLDCWIQIDWQDTEIYFDGDNDYWSTQLESLAYAPCPDDAPGKNAQDPWGGADYYTGGAGRYYESFDGAVIFVRSNNPLSMMVHTNGDLLSTDPLCGDCTIPTWFTVALCPFWVEGVQLDAGLIPISGGQPGVYLFDDAGEFGYDDTVPGYFFPYQKAFACEPASQEWTLGPLCPYVEGTIKFLARVLRHGLEDAGGDYHTFLDVHFSTS